MTAWMFGSILLFKFAARALGQARNGTMVILIALLLALLGNAGLFAARTSI